MSSNTIDPILTEQEGEFSLPDHCRSELQNLTGLARMNLFCKVYLDSSMPKISILAFLCRLTGGLSLRNTVSTDAFEIYVDVNAETDDVRSLFDVDNGFLFYRYFLDIEPRVGVSEEIYIAEINNLIARISNDGILAVASCNFEERLSIDPSRLQQRPPEQAGQID